MHPPVFYLGHNILEIGFYLGLQVEPTVLKTKTGSSLQNVLKKARRRIMSTIVITVLIYHRCINGWARN
jgi:hypothetical protein